MCSLAARDRRRIDLNASADDTPPPKEKWASSFPFGSSTACFRMRSVTGSVNVRTQPMVGIEPSAGPRRKPTCLKVPSSGTGPR